MDKKEEQGEKEEQSIVIVSNEKIPLTKLPRPENRRSSGVLGLIRSALFLARRRRRRRASPKVSLWRAILGSTRPLPLHQVQPAPQNPDAFHDVLPLQLSPPHPSALSPPSSASEDAMSRYASAEDLREMDEDGEGEGEGDGDGEAPNAIDLKAEEFIVRFYEQIRLQRLESIEHEMFDA